MSETRGWHYAPRSAREDIEAHGLDWRRSPAAQRPQDPRNKAPVANYFSPSEVAALDLGLGEDYDLYEVDLSGISTTPDPYQPHDAFYTLDAIPPARIRRTAGEDHSDHVMVCLRPKEKTRKAFADMDECSEDVDELHLTLYYLGTTDDAGGEPGKERLYRGLYDFAIHSGYSSLRGVPNGFGVFANPDTNVLISLWDIPEIAEFRTRLMDYCKDHGFEPRKDNHGFTPHMTLAFSDDPITTLPERPAGAPDEDDKEHFVDVWMVWGDEWTQITLP